MKSTLKSIAYFAAAALFATGCQVEESLIQAPQDPGNTISVRFTASETETRAAFGQYDELTQRYPTFWTAADSRICMSLNMNDPVYGEVIKTEEVSASADFTGNFVDTGAPYKFYALTPISVVNGINESRSSWSVSIPTIQTPKADGLSCDENSMLLYAESDVLESLPEDKVRMHLHHVSAYCRLALKNLSTVFATYGISDAKVHSVDVSYSVPVSGDWYINVSDGSLTPKDASHTITINTSIADPTQPTDLWFSLAPGVLDGQKVKVTVNTDKGRVSRDYTYGTRTYVAGTVNKLSLDMTKNSHFDPSAYEIDEDVFELVTNLADIKVNDQVVIVDDVNPSCAMSTTLLSQGYFESVAKDAADGFRYSEDDGYIRLPEGSRAVVWTIASKTTANAVTFRNSGGRYLATTGSGSSVVFSVTTSSASARAFTLYDFTGGEIGAYYSANSGNNTYYYSIAPSADDFFFLNSQTTAAIGAISLFKKKSVHTTFGQDLDNDPILDKIVYGAYLTDESMVHTPGATQLSREYDASSVTFSILTPSTNSIVEISGIPASAAKGDSFEIVLASITGRKVLSTRTYSVTVVMEEGPKLWLSDFAGNGFIVKR